MPTRIEQQLRIVHEQTELFLSQHLPSIGGSDWWNQHIIRKLTFQQEKQVKERNIKTLGELDVAALLGLMDKNWMEIRNELNLRFEGRTLISEMRNIRNRWAHKPLDGFALHDQLRDADTIFRYLKLLGAEESSLISAKKVWESLLKESQLNLDNQDAESVEQSDEEVSPPESTETEAKEGDPEKRQGIPVDCLGPKSTAVKEVRSALESATYVGIDFGTSTTVVSVRSKNSSTGEIVEKPIPIRQYDDSGREIEHHLLPTCIAWNGERVLVGRGAVELKPEYEEGRNVWSSFKMMLGVNLGPQYPNTLLAEGKGPVTIESPQDATQVFFSYIREAVEKFVEDNKLPSKIFYSVSVPASFEANQRKDLMAAIENAGISIQDSSLIDEPNAAFLSYLVTIERDGIGSSFIDNLTEKKRILVFDFGAGTCDISILEVHIEDDQLSSRNLAISKFLALGGDDIDKAIARKILLPQLCDGQDPFDIFTTNELETKILPKLKPAAEVLKIQCSKMAEHGGLRFLEELTEKEDVICGKPIPAISSRGKTWELREPKLSMAEFGEILEPFVSGDVAIDLIAGSHEVPSVLEPVENAIEKANLTIDDLHMVLFIGGSSENPFFRSAIEKFVGGFVDCKTPEDLRSHVSLGAAVHCMFVHGLDREMIRPITSESIYVVTRNDGLELVLPAGTPVPSLDYIQVVNLVVGSEWQQKVELPLCVSGRDKVLGVITVPPPKGREYFKKGDELLVSCSITREKLINIRVQMGIEFLTASLMNPLANAELTKVDRQYLQAQQVLNQSILDGSGRPSVSVVLNFAYAAQKSRYWRKAAEMFEAVERLDNASDHSISIAYCYSWDGDRKRATHWKETAYRRSPNSITAYNLALARKYEGKIAEFESLMEESLSYDPDETATLCNYGVYLKEKGDHKGIDYIQRAFNIFNDELNNGELRQSDLGRFSMVAKTLGKSKALEAIGSHKKMIGAENQIIQEEYLAEGKSTLRNEGRV